MKYNLNSVFTPNTVPSVTYVERSTLDLERQLRSALQTTGLITSISGPSKTGKTVLVKTVIDDDDIILISGASITSAVDLWERVLSWMESSGEVVEEDASSTSYNVSTKATAGVSIPKIVSLSGEGGGGFTSTGGRKISKKQIFKPIDQVVKEIANSAFVIFIDDFHYMKAEVQYELSRQIKEVAEKGVKICTASVPHRSDDVVRSNTELRGRVQAVDVGYWSPEQIRQIGLKGFLALNVNLSADVLDRLTKEAFGSPQLMQAMCLQLCYLFDIEETQVNLKDLTVADIHISKILERTSTTTDFSTLLENLHKGPKPRGLERKEFFFKDHSVGDVYRSILLAVKSDPPVMTYRYDEIVSRVKLICLEEPPVGSSVNEALKQMDVIAKTTQPASVVIEWNEDVLDIVDPYFLFYIRSSEKLDLLRKNTW